ncbi:MAG TPA: ATP-binding cassette domain-containing protein [Myxococcota bacterium]|nr:ATP-binding cassette domain-containing protein [Myxococcota bacterium]
MKLEAKGISRSYGGRRVLHQFSLRLDAGQVHGLLGPNGAGKTTAFRILCGVERADEGEVWLNGVRVDGLPLHQRARRGLGYLPQEDSLLADLSVAENVSLAARLSGSGASPAQLLERVGLTARATAAIAGLSGGERRRLALARLLALRPTVLLLDEPFAGVDPIAVAGFQQLVRGLAADGVAVLVTDHAVRETLAICDQATLLDGGEIQVSGSPSEVAANPHARARYLGPDFAW